jgi:predicted MFS family arabinose efflux permease
MQAILRNKLLMVTYALTFLFALHYAIPVYATSSYLHKYFSSSTVSGIYFISSVLTILVSISIAKSIRKFHTYPFTFAIVIGEIITISLFALIDKPYILALFFIVHFILQTLLYICLNVFIESFSKEAGTGSIRGLFLAVFNMGILISPLIGGMVLSRTSFMVLYLVSAATLIPFLYFLHKYLYHIQEPAYHSIDIRGALRAVARNKNMKIVLVAELTVQCFYSVMVIYSPLYLTTIGIPLTTYLSFILPLALIPLVILPYELGLIADSKFGEKNILLTGLLILATTTFLFVITTSTDPRIWVLLLLLSRIGASCVETMAFSYYFKKVGPEDASLTALFSNTQGVSIIIVGAIGAIVGPLLVSRPQLMFIILGCGILWTISYVFPMKNNLPTKTG